ncbi:hypothetical protein NST33_18255 [Paenibacillus sp. FSL L8-0435]|uniref:hypothetical protein n=1 Tax=Paenibacillus sp. FSL L8-0435 TaxID=2954618 RepID=UPI0030DC465B
MKTIILPTSQWLSTLQIGDPVCIVSTVEVGGDVIVKETRIKSITKTGLIKVEGSHYSFKDGYRRGYQYSGNCWLQQV